MKAYEGPGATWQAASAATYRHALIRWALEKYKRVHALTDADLGYGLAAWAQALTLMEGMTSDRTRKAITSLPPRTDG